MTATDDAPEKNTLMHDAPPPTDCAAVALLVAVGSSYSRIVRGLRMTPETAHQWATVGALLLRKSGDVPEGLADRLTNLPPLNAPCPERHRLRRVPDAPPVVDLDAGVLLASLSYPDLDDLAALSMRADSYRALVK